MRKQLTIQERAGLLQSIIGKIPCPNDYAENKEAGKEWRESVKTTYDMAVGLIKK